MTAKHVVLVGLMGTGKTTVGKRVARELGREFHDSDADIECREGLSVREIFEARGESEFRELESALLERLLVSDVPLVLATGGGVVLAERNRRLLKGSHHVVWLRATVDTLDSRLRVTKGAGRRPLLDGDLRERLETLSRDRSDLYHDVATSTIDVDGLDSERVCDLVVACVRGDQQ